MPEEPHHRETPTRAGPHKARPTAGALTTHLQRIQSARTLANAAALSTSEATKTASDVIAHIWEMLFDTLCQSKATDIEELTTASTVIQRLTSAFNHLATHELKTREADRKGAEAQANNAGDNPDATTDNHPAKPASLSPETLRHIERELSLL